MRTDSSCEPASITIEVRAAYGPASCFIVMHHVGSLPDLGRFLKRLMERYGGLVICDDEAEITYDVHTVEAAARLARAVAVLAALAALLAPGTARASHYGLADVRELERAWRAWHTVVVARELTRDDLVVRAQSASE